MIVIQSRIFLSQLCFFLFILLLLSFFTFTKCPFLRCIYISMYALHTHMHLQSQVQLLSLFANSNQNRSSPFYIINQECLFSKASRLLCLVQTVIQVHNPISLISVFELSWQHECCTHIS